MENGFLSGKDIAFQLDCSIATAFRINKEIKDLYEVKAKKITQRHLNMYLGLL